MARPPESVLIGSFAHVADTANVAIDTTKAALTQRVTAEGFIVSPPQKVVERAFIPGKGQ